MEKKEPIQPLILGSCYMCSATLARGEMVLGMSDRHFQQGLLCFQAFEIKDKKLMFEVSALFSFLLLPHASAGDSMDQVQILSLPGVTWTPIARI